MSNPCDCCQGKIKFIRKINGNYMHSMFIPEWFLNYFGRKIPGTVKLEAPNGITYDVGVTKNMNRTILKSGWAAFVDANEIEENYSLMFRYLGNARFEVTIFDSNGKEKALCCAEMKATSGVPTPNNRYVDNSSSSSDDNTQSSSADGSDKVGCQKESSCRYCKSANKPALSYTSEEFSEESLELKDLQMHSGRCGPTARVKEEPATDGEEISSPGYEDHGSSDNAEGAEPPFILPSGTRLTKAQEKKVLEKVSAIESEQPIYATVMNKCSIRHGHSGADLYIGKQYASRYLLKKCTTGGHGKRRSVISLVLQRKGKGRKWDTELRCTSDRTRISKGWTPFARYNGLREDDICLFKLMEKEEPLKMMVYIIRREKC